MKYPRILLMNFALSLFAAHAQVVLEHDAEHLASLRNGPLNEEASAPGIASPINDDMRVNRNYPMQAPIIPHSTEKYQVDLNINQCLTCHSRRATQKSSAPTVSVTHYMNRDGNFLAEVSPRRYFCGQCHVPQTDAPILVNNTYQDVDAVIESQRNQQSTSE